MRARIYQYAKSSTQSGQAKSRFWIVEYGQTQPRRIDPLMGWTGTCDTSSQIRVSFHTKDEAIHFAEENNMAYDLEETPPKTFKSKSYSDNFRPDRVQNWTH